jgi:hypothetical protein
MGWLGSVCAALAALLSYLSGNAWFSWLALASGAAATWSYGIMHNYAMEAAKSRPSFSGRFYDITEREADTVPNWLAALNLFSSVASFLLLIAALVVRFLG